MDARMNPPLELLRQRKKKIRRENFLRYNSVRVMRWQCRSTRTSRKWLHPRWRTSFLVHLDKSERDSYAFVRGTLLYDNGEKIEHDYTMHQLETVERKMKVLENVVNIIKSKQFQRFNELVNPEDVFRYNKQALIDGVHHYDSTSAM